MSDNFAYYKGMFRVRQSIEIFHLLFLRHLEQKLDKNLYALKGGCNLRFFFKSIRYSEDIDLDIRTIAKETLRHKIIKVLESIPFTKSLNSQGIERVHCVESKQSETTQRWKCGLKIANASMVLPTKIEFSRRNMTDACIFEPVDNTLIQQYNLYPVLSNHYVATEAFYQKIDALIFRTETQARDVFDLKLLLPSFKPKNNSVRLSRSDLHKAISNLESISFSDFKSTVVAYLMDEYKDYYDNPGVWTSLKNEVRAVLETMQP
jgi:predicted nucleotidyltransferase component of viral defense system